MPYNPGIQDQSGQLLAQGIGQGGDALAKGLQTFLEKRKRQNDNAKQLEALVKNNPELQEATGMDFEHFRSQSTQDKIASGMAAVTNLQMKNAQRQAAAKQDEDAARASLLRGQLGEQQQRMSDQQASAISLARFKELNGGELPPGYEGPPRSPAMNLQEMLGNAGRAGLGPKDISLLADADARLGKAGSGDASDVSFVEDPVSKTRFALHKGTLLPSGSSVDLAEAGKAMGLVDQEGNPIGAYAVRNPKGGLQIVKPPSEAKEGRDTAASVAQLETVLQGLDKQIQNHETRNAGIAAKDPTYKGMQPTPPDQISGLKQRRARVQMHLNSLDMPGAGGSGGAGAGAGVTQSTASPTQSAPSGTKEQIRADFQAGKITKDEALKRLRAMGLK